MRIQVQVTKEDMRTLEQLIAQSDLSPGTQVMFGDLEFHVDMNKVVEVFK